MKTFFLIGLIFCTVSVFATSKELNLKVNNIDCEKCARVIKRQVMANPEVTSINVDLSTKTVSVYGKQSFSFSKVIASIKGLGYSVESIQQKKSIIGIKADGVVCSFCVIGIEKQFNALDEVETAEFFLDKGELLLTLYPKKAIRDDIIHTIYNDAGYDVKTINRKTL